MGAPRWPVTMKGVVLVDDTVLLVHNERDEWELPGGRLEPGETPEACVRREIAEEVSLAVEVLDIVDAWVYPVLPEQSVLVVTYGCRLVGAAQAVLSDEHDDVAFVPLDDLDTVRLPDGYRTSIRRWAARHTS